MKKQHAHVTHLSAMLATDTKIQHNRKDFFYWGLLVFSGVVFLFYALLRARRGPEFFEGFEVPKINPAGADLRAVLSAGKAVLAGSIDPLDYAIGHPPFEIFLLLPFVKLSAPLQFTAFSLVLILCLWGMIFFSLQCGGISGVERLLLATLISSILFHTYPVLFAVERGNTDMVAGVFIALFLVGLYQNKSTIALVSLLVAVHIKIYPVILLPYFFRRFGYKKTGIFLLCAVSGFFILGSAPANGFFTSIIGLHSRPYVWEGNHSLASFLQLNLGEKLKSNQFLLDSLRLGLTVPFIFILWPIIFGKNENKKREKLSLFTSFILMILLPGTSHAYRIPIMIIPFLHLLMFGLDHNEKRKRTLYLAIIPLAVLTGLLFAPRTTVLLVTPPRERVSFFQMLFGKTEILLILYFVTCFLSFFNARRERLLLRGPSLSQ